MNDFEIAGLLAPRVREYGTVATKLGRRIREFAERDEMNAGFFTRFFTRYDNVNDDLIAEASLLQRDGERLTIDSKINPLHMFNGQHKLAVHTALFPSVAYATSHLDDLQKYKTATPNRTADMKLLRATLQSLRAPVLIENSATSYESPDALINQYYKSLAQLRIDGSGART